MEEIEKKTTYQSYDEMIFCNGGDRKEDNIPELAVCEALGIKPVFNVGGEKVDSSSEILANYKGA